MSDTIFIRNGESLSPLKKAPFESEDTLQALLAKYPELLAGEQMDPGNPRRWVLVAREMGIPDSEEAANRWSLDHLFVDQDSIPTLVEVKRASDSRIRREVVGQMLDYASNAIKYWPVAVIRAAFEESSRSQGSDPDEMIRELLRTPPQEQAQASDLDTNRIDAFWKQLGINLEAGCIRMVFVADEIPEELKRIVEFLNGQMENAEMLAVELPQFVEAEGSRLQTLVPRVFGMTAAAQSRKRRSGSTSTAVPLNESSIFPLIKAAAGVDVAQTARAILAWSKANALNGRIDWTSFGFSPAFKGGKDGFCPFRVDSRGNVRILFQSLRFCEPFVAEAKREELIGRLNAIPGVVIPMDATNGKPAIPVSALTAPDHLQRFYAEINWVREQVEQAFG